MKFRKSDRIFIHNAPASDAPDRRGAQRGTCMNTMLSLTDDDFKRDLDRLLERQGIAA